MLKLVLVGLSVVLFNCSLMGLNDIELMNCVTPTDGTTDPCEALNKGRAADACMRYQCAPDGKGCVLAVADKDYDKAIDPSCEKYATGAPKLDCDDKNPKRYPGNAEVCDGTDNNCDMVIDEDSAIDYKKSPPKQVISASAETSRIVFSPSNAGDIVLTYGASAASEAGVRFTLLSGFEETTDYPLYTDKNIEETKYECGLTQRNPEGAKGLGCVLGEVATTAKVAEKRIAAAVNLQGCDDGQLRVGLIDNDEAPEFVARRPASGKSYLCNTYNGIDVQLEPERPCSGASHPNFPGAARIGIASLESEPQDPQALLVWLGDSVNRTECGNSGPSVPVQALGLWLDTDPSNNKWVVASDDAVPRTLGQTVGGGRPALAVWPGTPADRGYFVGYADQGGQVALHFIPPLEKLPDPDNNNAREVPKLTLMPAYKFSDNRSGADHIAIAPANKPEKIIRAVCGPGQTGLEIGVAWQEKCGQEKGGLFFAVVGFVTSTQTFCLQHDIVEIASGSAADGQLIPSVAYLGDRFVERGYTRKGKTAVDDETGGWVVAWAGTRASGEREVFARRIAELDGQLLDEKEQIVLSGGFKAVSNPVLYPSKPGKNGLNFAFKQSQPDGFVGGTLLACEAK